MACLWLYLDHGTIEYDRPHVRADEDGKYYSVGTIATFTCEAPYSLSSSSSLTCQASGSWSGQNPECIGNMCTWIDVLSWINIY